MSPLVIVVIAVAAILLLVAQLRTDRSLGSAGSTAVAEAPPNRPELDRRPAEPLRLRRSRFQRQLDAAGAKLWLFAIVILLCFQLESLAHDTRGYFAVWVIFTIAAAWLYQSSGGPWLDRRVSLWRALLRMVLLFLAGWALLFLVTLVTPAIPDSQVPKSHLLEMSAPMIVVAVLMIPLAEELAFRGFLYGAIAVRGPVTAIVVTTTADFAAHWIGHDLQYALRVLAGAVVAGLLRAWTRGLTAPFLLHASLDALLL